MHKIYFKIAASAAEAFKIAQAMEEANCQVFTVQAVFSEAYEGMQGRSLKYFWHIWGRYDVTVTSAEGIDEVLKRYFQTEYL